MSTVSTPFSFFVEDVSVSLLPPALIAANDLYSVAKGGSLTVPYPGVLGNDTGPLMNLTATRLTSPAQGTLSFNPNGGFTYTPVSNFTGIDSFTYQVNDVLGNSNSTTVSIDVTPPGNVFYDNFQHSGSGAPFAPWVVGLGEWSIGDDELFGSGTFTDFYSDAYIPTVLGDFTIETQFQLPTNAWACGLSGRDNPLTGQRYVANVYPEGSPYGPSPALRLIKFHSWGEWSSTWTPMALVGLPPIGTSPHILKLAFYGNHIDVYLDGSPVLQTIDDNVDDLPPYRTGAFGAHMYMYSPYQAVFNYVSVSALPPFNTPPVLPAQNDQVIPPLTTLLVTNTAIDSDLPTNTLSYALVGAPVGAGIDTNGIITWTPTKAQDLTTNLFTTVVTDSNPTATNAQHLSATNSFTVTVVSRPIPAITSTELALETCLPTNNAIDPGETVTLLVSLKNIGLQDSTALVATLLPGNGVTSPTGPQTYGALVAGGAALAEPFTFTATGLCGVVLSPTFQLQDGALDLGTLTVPLLLGRRGLLWNQNFDAVTAPALPSGWTTSAVGAESAWVTRSSTNNTSPNAAFVPDAANVGLSDLVSPPILLPAGLSQLSFANNYDLETHNATEGYDGAVLEIQIGTGPFLDILDAGGAFVTNGYNRTLSSLYFNPLGGRRAWSGTSPGFVTTVVNLPAGAAGQTIRLRWRCGTDNGNGRSGWSIDSIAISNALCCIKLPPVLPTQADPTIPDLTTLVVTNTATDSTVPPGFLAYSLLNPPAGATIDTNGIIEWTPSAAEAPSTNLFQTVVTDNPAGPGLDATNSFLVIVEPPPNVLPPAFQPIICSPAGVTLTWSSVSGRTYRLQYTEDLSHPNWSNVVPDLPATGPTICVTNDVGASTQRFFRVILLP
jgi:hypothetical protein